MIKGRILAVTLLCLWLMPVMGLAAGQVDDKIDDFDAQTSLDGESGTFSLDKALTKGPVVVYFFPAAYTRGCDIEAHSFSQNKEKFDEEDATIIGVSADPADKLKDFSANPDFAAGAFAMASDPEGEIASRFGLDMERPEPGTTDVNGDKVSHGLLPRVTFVLDQDGRIVKRLSTQEDDIQPNEHAPRALKAVKALQSNEH